MLRNEEFDIEAPPTSAPEGGAWPVAAGSAAIVPESVEPRADWRAVDRALRAIARQRAGLDADEMRWLREAEALQIWRPLGMVSALDYLERVFGYTPRAAHERLRVARALGALPGLGDALAAGALPFSAVRELTRVATPATEASWVAAAAGKNLRQIEDLVSGRRPGDRPDDPADPEARTHIVRFELAATTFAQLRQTRGVLDEEHGTHLSDDELIAALCDAVLDGAPAVEPTGRARFQIAVTVCERCRQGWQEGAGAKIAIEAAGVERALCDAQHIGSLDGDGSERAYQDVPPSVVRFVWRRDGGRCRVPGCRSARGLEIHHLIHRADGGSHEASNLALLCSACHLAHHRGALVLGGTAAQLVAQRPGTNTARRESCELTAHVGSPRVPTQAIEPAAHAGPPQVPAQAIEPAAHAGPPQVPAQAIEPAAHVGPPRVPAQAIEPAAHVGPPRVPTQAIERTAHVGPPRVRTEAIEPTAHVGPTREPIACSETDVTGKLDAAVLRTQSKQALVGLGWKPAVAAAAVTAALGTLGAAVPIEQLIFEALRRCPRPNA